MLIPEDEDVLDLEIRRTGGRKVTVRVVGHGDEPVAGAFIASRTIGLILKGRTDADGRVELEEVPARAVRILVYVTAPGLLPRPALTIPPGNTEVTVRFEAAGPDGLVSFTDLPGAEARVWVQMPESSDMPESAVNPKQAIVVPSGRRVEMRFRIGAMLAGIVRGPDGEPLAGAVISVMSLEGVSQNLTSGSDGRFRCPAAIGVAHYIRAGGPDAAGKPLNGFRERIRPEDGEIEIRLAAPHR